MKVNLKLFGITREIFGVGEQTISFEDKVSVREMLEMLKTKHSALADLSSILVAVNNEYAESDMILAENDEVALIPPVSGG